MLISETTDQLHITEPQVDGNGNGVEEGPYQCVLQKNLYFLNRKMLKETKTNSISSNLSDSSQRHSGNNVQQRIQGVHMKHGGQALYMSQHQLKPLTQPHAQQTSQQITQQTSPQQTHQQVHMTKPLQQMVNPRHQQSVMSQQQHQTSSNPSKSIFGGSASCKCFETLIYP